MLAKPFRIAILEDSAFYNRLLTRQLESYTAAIALDHDLEFDIRSYLHPDDFLINLAEDTDVAFVDFYLGNGVNAQQLLDRILKRCPECKVVVISQGRNVRISAVSLSHGAYAYIHKDRQALPRSCFLVEDIVNARLSA